MTDRPFLPPVYDFTEGNTSTSSNPSEQLPPVDEQLVLTWNNGAEVLGPATAVEAHISATAPEFDLPRILPPSSPPPVELSPPGYTQAQRPREKVIYAFSHLGVHGMVLLPPSNAQDTRPQYYISVSMNCFMPLSHITTLYRGANEHGPRVGEFELGIMNAASSRVQMGSQPSVPISVALMKTGPRENAMWRWKPSFSKVKNMTWDYTQLPYVCRASVEGSLDVQIIARFTTHLRIFVPRAGTLDDRSRLEVFPAGQEYFDEIVLSLLVIERKRLTPKTKSQDQMKHLFNY